VGAARKAFKVRKNGEALISVIRQRASIYERYQRA